MSVIHIFDNFMKLSYVIITYVMGTYHIPVGCTSLTLKFRLLMTTTWGMNRTILVYLPQRPGADFTLKL